MKVCDDDDRSKAHPRWMRVTVWLKRGRGTQAVVRSLPPGTPRGGGHRRKRSNLETITKLELFSR